MFHGGTFYGRKVKKKAALNWLEDTWVLMPRAFVAESHSSSYHWHTPQYYHYFFLCPLPRSRSLSPLLIPYTRPTQTHATPCSPFLHLRSTLHLSRRPILRNGRLFPRARHHRSPPNRRRRRSLIQSSPRHLLFSLHNLEPLDPIQSFQPSTVRLGGRYYMVSRDEARAPIIAAARRRGRR